MIAAWKDEGLYELLEKLGACFSVMGILLVIYAQIPSHSLTTNTTNTTTSITLSTTTTSITLSTTTTIMPPDLTMQALTGCIISNYPTSYYRTRWNTSFISALNQSCGWGAAGGVRNVSGIIGGIIGGSHPYAGSISTDAARGSDLCQILFACQIMLNK